MRLISVALLAALALATAGCGDDSADAAAARDVQDLKLEGLGEQVLDLAVRPEDSAVARNARRPFVDGVGLYSLRRGEMLQATLQVSRFTKAADADGGRFRSAVVGQIGSTVPQAFRMGDETVYLTTGRRQSIAVWFKGRHFFVLSTREEYEQPRTLLRELIGIEP